MKRYRLPLTALTVAGALVLGTTPAALAAPTNSSVQQLVQDEANLSGTEAPVGTTAGIYVTLDDNTYYQHEQGGWVSEEANVDAELTTELETEIAANADIIEQDRDNGGNGLGGAELPGANPSAEGSSSAGEGTAETTDAGSSGSSNISNVAGILLPASLVIGGATWYLNQDGQTYVTEQSRTRAVPSSEEKATSEQMLNNNAAEVTDQAIAAQLGEDTTGATAAGTVPAATGAQQVPAGTEATTSAQDTAVAPRGMAAETGSNTVPRALTALALISLLGAALLAFRRRLA